MEVAFAGGSYHPWNWGNKGKRLELLKARILKEANILSEKESCLAGTGVTEFGGGAL